jgi:acyl dehydratase
MTDKKGFFDLREVRALIGKEMELTEAEAYLAQCPVDVSELRRYALSVEDCNPLWFDHEYAKKTKWNGIIAPPTFMHTCGGGTALAGPSHIPGIDDWPHGSLYAGSKFEFFLPIRIGDKIKPQSKLHDVVEKSGKFVGPMVLATAETTFTNQKGELVGIWYQSVMKYSTAEAQKRKTYTEEELGPLFPPGHPDMKKGKSTARGATPLYYEDVPVGMEIPSMVRQLTIPQIVATADVSQRIGIIMPYTMPGPGCYWHYAVGESWKMRGLPAPMDEGPIRAAQPSQLMTDWIGDEGWLSKLSFQIRRPIYAGDTTTWKGRVTNKSIKGKDHLVECEIWGENQRGQTSTKGNATVILPSRS